MNVNVKSLVSFVLLINVICASYSQDVAFDRHIKKNIDSSMFGTWARADFLKISDDGAYVAYMAFNKPIGSNTLYIQSLDKKWRFAIANIAQYDFMQNSKKLVYYKTSSELGVVDLGDSLTQLASNIESYKLSSSVNKCWLAYLHAQSKSLSCVNLASGESQSFKNVLDYSFNRQGTALMIKVSTDIYQELYWIDLVNEGMTKLWKGTGIGAVVYDESGLQVAFLASEDTSSRKRSSIWYYKSGSTSAQVVLSDTNVVTRDRFAIGEPVRFTHDGHKIYFQLQEVNQPTVPKTAITSVDVWSYMDPKLQSQQLKELGRQQQYLAISQIGNHKLEILESEGERILFPSSPAQEKYCLLVKSGPGDLENEWNWNSTARSDVFLVSTGDWSRVLISKDVFSRIAYSYQISPSNKYVIFYDPINSDYWSFDIVKKTRINLTKGIQADWTSYHHSDEPDAKYRPYGIAAFIKGKDEVLICDQRDIFKIDLSGRTPPICITARFGKKNNMEFRIAPFYNQQAEVSYDDDLLLSVFNHTTKDDGFYKVKLDRVVEPVKLSSHASLITGPSESAGIETRPIIRSKFNNVFVVKKEYAHSSPNYFYTKDFKNFYPVSDIYPEKEYVWLSTELISFKTVNGSDCQGILYKPENFNPNRKYPIIFYYYERFSDCLHVFSTPDFSLGRINIPYFVTKDYLVFVPDIPKVMGYPGKSALNAVESAANYFKKKPWIDSTAMGIQGHSFGGFETNYIVTHSKLFAAAVSASSMSNFISCYGSIMWMTDGTSRQRQYEVYHDAMGGSLWEIPERYIDNSPVLNTDRVMTPILLMSNNRDADVPSAQGVEFFTALRRLGKRAWMLQYDEGDHLVFGNDAIDYTIRVKQFYDHYLKKSPPPNWMTKGIPAKMKGVETGFELDNDTKIDTTRKGLLIWEHRKREPQQ